jgi:7,8-dihydropterin-6-yl-methyl-4-(beta-D-ribofuranosyl)aminobenzene 5'-phosphate synthase
MSYREGAAFVRDYTEDDQALIINVQGKGLVILSGCAHSGVVNTVNHAREISGVRQVWAILGGFHLAKADITEIERTIDEIVRFKPKMVVPSHCTGLKAVSRFAQRLPAEFKEGLVGATFLF